VDRLKIAQRLSQQRSADRPALDVLLQVNISGEASKRGALPQELPDLAHQVVALPRLRLRGLMAIPEPAPESARQASFARMRDLFEQLKQQLTEDPGRPSQAQIAQELSMTENAVKQAFHRLRQRYRQLLRDEIAQTVAVPGDVEDEVRHFISVLQA